MFTVVTIQTADIVKEFFVKYRITKFLHAKIESQLNELKNET